MSKWEENLESHESEKKIFQPENNGRQVGKLVESKVDMIISSNAWTIITTQSHTEKHIRGRTDILC